MFQNNASSPADTVDPGPGDPPQQSQHKPFDPTRAEAASKAILAQGGSQSDVDSFLQQEYGLAPHVDGAQRFHDEYAVGNLGRRMAAENAQDAAEVPSQFMAQAGGLAALGERIPFVPKLQAVYRSLARLQPLDQSKADIASAEGAAPSGVRTLNNMIGSTVANAVIPGSPAKAGALYALADEASQDQPNSLRGLGNAAVAAATGHILEGLTNIGRGSDVAKKAVDAKSAMRAVDQDMYGSARSQAAAAGGTSPAVQAILQHPRIQPYADQIRADNLFTRSPVDDASVLMDLHNELSQGEGGLIDRITGRSGVGKASPITAREARTIQATKEMIRSALSDGPDAIAPDFRPAVAEHAGSAQALDEIGQGSDLGKRAIAGKLPKGSNLATRTPAAAIAAAPSMPPSTAANQTTGVLGALNAEPATFNPLKILSGRNAASRVSPAIRAFDANTGSTPAALADFLERAGLSVPGQIGR